MCRIYLGSSGGNRNRMSAKVYIGDINTMIEKKKKPLVYPIVSRYLCWEVTISNLYFGKTNLVSVKRLCWKE